MTSRSKIIRERVVGFFALCALLTLAVSCSKESLQRLDRFVTPTKIDSGVTVNFCTDPAQVVKSKLKYVIVLDHSGSNQINYKMDSSTGDPILLNGALDVQSAFGTDPLRYSRYGDVSVTGSLLNFLDQTPENDPSDPSVYFSLFTFSGAFSQWPSNNTFYSLVHSTGTQEGFFDHVLNDKNNTSDQGSTNYLDTLRAVQNLIQADINQARSCSQMSVGAAPTASCPHPGKIISSSYVIVMMSDGAPITNVSLNPLVLTRQPSRDVLGAVAGIMGLQSNSRYVDGINLFTVYYYQPTNPDFTAAKLLQDMATVGNGVFYNVTSGSNIDYRQFTPPSRLIKYSLADIFVTNSSVTVDADGEAHADRDMDGLPDDQEIVVGSAIDKADSDGNGVGDLIESVTHNGQPCGQKSSNGQCVKGAGTVNYRNGMCSSIASQIVGGNVVFVSSDPDGLNDCEKLVLSDTGGINDPDSNGDIVPDWLEFKNGLPFQLGTQSIQQTQDSDGVSYYEKIKTSLPALTPYYRIANPHPATYNMQVMSSNAFQDCYQLVVDGLPVVGSDDMVRVDVIMRTPLLQDRYLYRMGQKRLTPGTQKITFNDWNDAGEQAAKTWKVWP